MPAQAREFGWMVAGFVVRQDQDLGERDKEQPVGTTQ